MTEKDITIMAVHAHPDDEVVFTGGTLAQYGDRGVRTVLVTATGGEEGEIHDPDLVEEEARPRLREIRLGELRRGIEVLGISDLELLGYRDSGMVGTEPNARPDNFHNADMDEATAEAGSPGAQVQTPGANHLRRVRSLRPPRPHQVQQDHPCRLRQSGRPTYHPELGEPWEPLKLYYTHWNEEGFRKRGRCIIERGFKWPFDREEEEKKDEDPEHEGLEDVVAKEAELAEKAEEPKKEEAPRYVPPPVTTRIDVLPAHERKWKSTMMHRTQFSPDGVFTTMPRHRQVAFGEEHYSLVALASPSRDRKTICCPGCSR